MGLALAMARRPGVIASVSLILLALVLGSVLPPPSNWLRNEDAQLTNVHVAVVLDYHVFSESWTLEENAIDLTDPRWLDWKAWQANTFTLGFEASHVVVFTLEDMNTNQPLAQERDATGRATPLTTQRVADVTFRLVDAGDYLVRVEIVDAGGQILAQERIPLSVVPGGA